MRERSFKLSQAKTSFITKAFGEQTRIADTVGVKLAVFSHYMHGRRHIPESVLMRLCQATNKKPSEFLENAAEKILADASFST